MIGGLTRFFTRLADHNPDIFIDPTGVKMRYSRYNCIICGAPGMECVDWDTCPRSDHQEYDIGP